MIDPILRTRLERAAGEWFPQADVLAAYAYGSRASGRPRPDSDLDIGYDLGHYWQRRALPIGEEMRPAGELSEAAGVAVDLRNLAGAPARKRSGEKGAPRATSRGVGQSPTLVKCFAAECSKRA